MAGESILAKMAVYISANTAQFTQQLALTNNKLTAFEKGVKSTALSISGALGFTGGVILLKNVIGSLAAFEAEMSNVRAVTQSSEADFNRLRNSAIDLSQAYGMTSKGVAELQTQYARLGFSTKEILQSSKVAIQLSQATGEDLANAAQIAGSTLRAFNLDASEMGRVGNVMAASFNKTALGLSDFGEAIKYVAPAASNAGMSIEQVSAALGVLADSGIKGSQAGTSFRKLIADIGSGDINVFTKRLQEMAKAGLSGAQALDEAGRTAYVSALVLVNNMDKWNGLTKAITGNESALDEVAHVVKDNLIGDWEKFNAAIDASIQKGTGFVYVLRQIVQFLTPLSDENGALALMAHRLQGGLGITAVTEKLKKLREESGQKLQVNFEELAKKYDLNSRQLARFKEAIDKVNEGYVVQYTEEDRATDVGKRYAEVMEAKRSAVRAFTSAIEAAAAATKKADDEEEEAYKKSEERRQERITKHDATQLRNLNSGNPVGLSAISVNPETLNAYNSMAKMQEHMKTVTDAATESILKQRSELENQSKTIARIGEIFGSNFGEMASGAVKFSDGIRKMANDVVGELYRVAQMQIIAHSAKLGPVGVFAATAGLAALRGLIGGLLSKGSGSSSGGYSARGYSNPYSDRAAFTFNVDVMARGSQLITATTEQNVIRGRTRG